MKYLVQLTALWALLASQQLLHSAVDAQLLLELTQTDPELSTFSSELKASGLDSVLLSEGPFTVFAPTDEAFATAVDPKYLEQPEWSAHLTEILLQHIVEGAPFLTESWVVGIELDPISGGGLNVTSAGGGNASSLYQIDNVSTVIAPDVFADNGVLHKMSAVILPPSARDDIVDVIELFPDFFSTLLSLLELAGLTDALRADGPFTLFAPTNEAFAVLPPEVLANLQSSDNTTALTQILLYHTSPGIWLFQDESIPTVPTLQVTDLPVPYDSFLFGDLLAKNGVIRIIDEVQILPEGSETIVPPASSTVAPTISATAVSKTIWDIVIASNFTIFASAMNQTDWPVLLQGQDETYTVFAVPDDGFEALPSKFVTDPMWSTHLLNVLTYHILPEVIFSVDMIENKTFRTLSSNAIAVTSSSPLLQVNNVNVTVTDIVADNGVVHVVQDVLLPPSATDTATDLVSNFPQFTILFDLLNATNLTSALDGEGPLTLAAPINRAFTDLPDGTLEALAADPDALRNLLMYHVVPELVDFASMGSNSSTHTTLQGGELTFSPTVQGVQRRNMIEEATVEFPDLLVQNGYVHVIDQVLIPPTDTGTAAPTDMATPLEGGTMDPTGPEMQTTAPTGMATVAATTTTTTTTIAPSVMASSMESSLTTTTAPSAINASMATTTAPISVEGEGETGAPTSMATPALTTIAPTSAETFSPTGMATSAATPMVTPSVELQTGAPTAMATVITTTMAPSTMAPSTPEVDTSSPTNAATSMTTTTAPTMDPSASEEQSPSPTVMATVMTMVPTTMLVSATETVRTNSNYSTLYDLLELASLLDGLTITNPVTLFAPTNEAFSKLPEGTIDALMVDVNELSNILLYHLIPDLVLSTDLVDGAEVAMAQGSLATVSLNPAMINDATITGPDGIVSNGVIHEIDTVLIPPGAEIASPPTAAESTPSPTTAESTSSPTAVESTSSPTTAEITSSPTAAEITSSPTAAETMSSPTAVETTLPPTAAETTSSPTVVETMLPPTTAESTASPTVAEMTPSPTEAPAATSGPSPNATVAPSVENCVNIPGVSVCCPPGQTDGVFFFCRFL